MQVGKNLVKIKGEFEETQAIVANGEEEAKEKARQRLGETLTSELLASWRFYQDVRKREGKP